MNATARRDSLPRLTRHRPGAVVPAAWRLHGAGVHGQDPLARRARDLPRDRGQPGRRPEVVDVPAERAGVLARLRARALSDAARAASPAVQPRLQGHGARAVVQHRRELHDEHQLAVLLRRIDTRLHRADGRPRGAELRLGRGRHLRRDRAGARLRAVAHRSARQLLGRPDPHRHAHPAADVDRLRGRSSSPAERSTTSTPPTSSTRIAGNHQSITGGPIACQEAIKQIGTNGGGPYNANSSHPFENPTNWTNWFQIYFLLVIGFALPRTFGRMVGDKRQGLAIVAVMAVLSVLSVIGLNVAQGIHHGSVPTSVGAASEGTETAVRRARLGDVRVGDDVDLNRRGRLVARLVHQPRRRDHAARHAAR